MSRFDPSLHAGVINNVRFSKEMFASNYDKIKMVLRTFYKNQGVQTNIGAVGKEDLQTLFSTIEQANEILHESTLSTF